MIDATRDCREKRAQVSFQPAWISRTDAALFVLFVALLFPCGGRAAQAAGASTERESAASLPTLTTARQVHSLSSAEAARRYPIHLRVVVTFFDPEVGAKRTGLFVHDSTGCIFVDLPQGQYGSLQAGSLIDLSGVSNPGEFAPIVSQPQIKVIGYSGLPENPDRPGLARLLSGAEDGQWVEVEGIIHSVRLDDRHVSLQLAMAEGAIAVVIVREAGGSYSSLVDAKVHIRANVGPLFDVSRRQLIGVRLQCPNLSAVKVVEAPPDDPFKLPIFPVYKLLRWDEAPLLAHRVHIQGRVTLQWPGSSVCIRDSVQGICAQTDQTTQLHVGELIDLAGFVKAEESAPVMRDAVFETAVSAVAIPIAAVPVTAEQALRGGYESQLIQIDGQLVSRDLVSSDTALLLVSGKSIFTAILPQGLAGPAINGWKNGSILRVTGICSVQLDEQRSGSGIGTAVPRALRILMRSPADAVVVQKPSWWTAAHALVVMALALTATLFVLGWVIVLRRRVEHQTILLRESEQQFRHLALHDALTGLATRLLLNDRLNAAVETAKRHQKGLALLMVDIDNFKIINDTFGHLAGDDVLRVTAGRLLEAVRKSDTVARMGGDEFVVLLPDLGDLKAAEKIAATMVETLASPISFAGSEVPVSVSIGLCVASEGDFDSERLLKYADAALYRAKAQGRNCFRVFAPLEVFSETA